MLSRESGAAHFAPPGLAEVPVTLDWAAHRKRVPPSRDEWARELATQVCAGGPVGLMFHHVMFHHAACTPDALEQIGQALAVLRASPNVDATGIAGLAADAAAPRR